MYVLSQRLFEVDTEEGPALCSKLISGNAFYCNKILYIFNFNSFMHVLNIDYKYFIN